MRENKYTCNKCGKEKNGDLDKPLAIYLYAGSGKEKQKGNADLCTECKAAIFDGWKYVPNLH